MKLLQEIKADRARFGEVADFLREHGERLDELIARLEKLRSEPIGVLSDGPPSRVRPRHENRAAAEGRSRAPRKDLLLNALRDWRYTSEIVAAVGETMSRASVYNTISRLHRSKEIARRPSELGFQYRAKAIASPSALGSIASTPATPPRRRSA